MKKATYLILACLGTVLCANAQTDMTSSIKNPSFETDGFDNWTNQNLVTQSNTSFTKKDSTFYLEKWVSSGNKVGDAKIYQTLNNLPMGKYTLTVGAQNLNQASTSTNCTGACIYAGDQQTTVYGPNDYSVDFTCITGQVEIGFVAKSATGNWIAVDNFRLTLNEEISNATAIEEINKLLPTAESLAALDIDAKAKEPLNNAITAAKALTSESASADVQSAMLALSNAIAKAEFAQKLANATAGTGTAVKVSSTNNYVPTGATQALMRFTCTGSNILEKGVCWSTEHNPTVLDDRSTDYWTLNGNIYHITGLKNSTVYYLRPYVMNSTYEVAYGDEVKIVTHTKGTCSWSWDDAGPDAATNTRCRTAIKQTIDYFNEWTGIKGFTLSGHYVPGAGSGSGTADCSYGGWMRISQNTANQAIGTVLHETGHGVGVGTQTRYWDTNVHNTTWYGSEASKMYGFLENKTVNPYNSSCTYYWRGDATHAWGQNATYDWFINGSDKDTHTELQYVGGCCMLYAMFIDGLCPTTSYENGLAGYTYNFDENKKYYIMCMDAERGLGSGLLVANGTGVIQGVKWRNALTDGSEITDAMAWYIGYNPLTGCYTFKNANNSRFLSHKTSTSGTLSFQSASTKTATTTEEFQLMPTRKDITVQATSESFTTNGYWFTWSSLQAMQADALSTSTANVLMTTFDYADTATKQQWIILSEDEMAKYWPTTTGIEEIASEEGIMNADDKIYTIGGQYAGKNLDALRSGLYILNGKKIVKK